MDQDNGQQPAPSVPMFHAPKPPPLSGQAPTTSAVVANLYKQNADLRAERAQLTSEFAFAARAYQWSLLLLSLATVLNAGLFAGLLLARGDGAPPAAAPQPRRTMPFEPPPQPPGP